MPTFKALSEAKTGRRGRDRGKEGGPPRAVVSGGFCAQRRRSRERGAIERFRLEEGHRPDLSRGPGAPNSVGVISVSKVFFLPESGWGVGAFDDTRGRLHVYSYFFGSL